MPRLSLPAEGHLPPASFEKQTPPEWDIKAWEPKQNWRGWFVRDNRIGQTKYR